MSQSQVISIKNVIIIAVVCFMFQKHAYSIEPGVPKDLALQRKNTISKITYDLFFYIPAVQKNRVMGEEIISLYLNNTEKDLILDFKEANPEIKIITANGKA